jgi:HSP20 family protein
VANHESPLSALARAGHGVLNVFPSLGIPEKAEKRIAEESRLLRSAMDVHETDEFIEFVADVPGANDDDLEVEVLKKDPSSSSHQELDVLVVRGKRDVLLEEPREEEEDVEKEKRKAEGSKLGTFRVRERHFGAFENRYALPPSVDVDRISAKTSKGVLTVTAPKLPVKHRRGSETAATAGAGGEENRRRRRVSRRGGRRALDAVKRLAERRRSVLLRLPKRFTKNVDSRTKHYCAHVTARVSITKVVSDNHRASSVIPQRTRARIPCSSS